MEQEEELFYEIENRIRKEIPVIKTVDIWNNQFIRSNGSGSDGRKENIPIYPCCFVEMVPEEFDDVSNGVQNCIYRIRFHIGYWSEKDRDFTIFEVKNKIYKYFHKWTPSTKNNFNSLLRRGEIINYDHDNVNEYIMEFTVRLQDFSNNKLGTPRNINVTIQEIVSFTQSQINI